MLELVKWLHDGKQYYYSDKLGKTMVELDKLSTFERSAVLTMMKNVDACLVTLEDLLAYFRRFTYVSTFKIYDLLL